MYSYTLRGINKTTLKKRVQFAFGCFSIWYSTQSRNCLLRLWKLHSKTPSLLLRTFFRTILRLLRLWLRFQLGFVIINIAGINLRISYNNYLREENYTALRTSYFSKYSFLLYRGWFRIYFLSLRLVVCYIPQVRCRLLVIRRRPFGHCINRNERSTNNPNFCICKNKQIHITLKNSLSS